MYFCQYEKDVVKNICAFRLYTTQEDRRVISMILYNTKKVGS